MGIVIVVIVVLLVVSMSVNSLRKTGQRARGRGRCEGCNSRLKAVSGRYATTCRRCGHVQSWGGGATPMPQVGPNTGTGAPSFIGTQADLEAARARVQEAADKVIRERQSKPPQ